MNINFSMSKTRENLMRAFAGESQARNRYTFAGEKAKNDKLQAIQGVFLYTANQELAHAKVFYDLLKESSGENITIEGNYPIDIHEDIIKILRSAEHNERQEYEKDYAEFAKTAEAEGFIEIANKFKNIAGIEESHSKRFGRLADLLEEGKLFIADYEIEWVCLNCGFIYKGKNAPEKCPVCSHDKGYFIRLEFAPFTAKQS